MASRSYGRDRRPTLTVDPKLRQTILDTEQLLKDDESTRCPLVGDEIKLEYYDPKLPDCLDRRPEPLLAEAARGFFFIFDDRLRSPSASASWCKQVLTAGGDVKEAMP